MGAEGHFDWRQAAANTLAWWDEAGVDMLVDEDPRDWLAAPVAAPKPATTQPATAQPATAEPATSGVAPASGAEAFPAELEAFLAWRAGEAAPEAGWPGGWVATSGPANAAVMILVDCPDRGDDCDGLLSGPSGRLFDRMLAAIGRSREEVHLATVCAKRPTAGRTPAAVEAQLAAIAAHHVALVAPKRLLLLGNAASRAILGVETRDARGRSHRFNHDRGQSADEQAGGGGTRVVATYHPRFLLEKPAAKTAAWADLQILMKDVR